ncbi:MAG TPA: bifunctional riboflavin kinase/FAD synthetase [Nitrospiraceae bacterium]|nr:bifunctional riboflavin kinase/FAD synthetase [Nitrospiraceae bacterium]
MHVIRNLTQYQPSSYPVATIGNFDGQHRGHQALLRTVVERAREAGGRALVITFDPHPVRILAPHVALKFLTSPEEKLAAFASTGIDEVIFLEFSRTLAELTPEAFVRDILVGRLSLRELFVGEHFAFGKGRAGTVADLQRFGARYGFSVHPMKPVLWEGRIISSTKVRSAILAGQMELAADYLGRLYALSGLVEQGDQRGRTLGWPTANLALPADRVVPPDGVYAALTVHGAQVFDSVAYIGTRPTFETKGERLLEVYLLNEQRTLYGERITVQFASYLRGDMTFPSPDALSRQIQLDVRQAEACLKSVRAEYQKSAGQSA